ncbi:MAG: glycosyltransferase family 2 protein [bacterium]|nr:glycosyltransferase family 2 protein [bacterium]
MTDTTELPLAAQAAIQWLPTGHEEPVDLAVIIVSWNVREALIANLKALRESRGTGTAELFVVDNASHDGSADAVAAVFPEAQVIKNTENLGFGRANNQAIHRSHARHVLCLNPDMRVAPDALALTIHYLDTHADVGIVGGRLSLPDGSLNPSVRRFPDFWSQLAVLLKLHRVFPHVMDRYLWKGFDYLQEQDVDSVRGSYFALSRAALDRVSGFDERFFFWFEEVDLCKQMQALHLRVVYVPAIRATDLVGQSFRQIKRFTAQRMFTRSMLHYFVKWHSLWQAVLLSCVRPFSLFGCFVIDIWNSVIRKNV